MRITLLVLFCIAILPIARSQEANKVEMQRFWDANIATIVNGDVEKVLSQTHFPLTVTRSKKEELTREKFKTQYKSFFSPYVIEQLKTGSISSLDTWTMDGDEGPTYMLVCSQSEETEAVFVFSFKQYEGSWLLYRIDEHQE